MKYLLSVLLFLSSVSLLRAQPMTEAYQPTASNLAARQDFSDARFGIFLHWGLYSMLATGEWTMTNR
ncbi:MAG: alpha-L-fucosidase, partial [Alloprevotella sp.]|nr:alpha-L-fucosidase [Alloprevotella sp.]